MVENEALSVQMQQTEKDTIDVITYLKRQDQEKDRQVRANSCLDLYMDETVFLLLQFFAV